MIRVLLVDDHALVRSGVRSELAGDPDIVVAGEASDVPSAVQQVAALRPDVVLLDVHLPGAAQAPGGQEVVQQCTDIRSQADAPVRFLALSVSDAVDDVIAVIRSGARGYVTKSISGPQLCDAIRRVAAGDAVFSPRLAGFVLDAFGVHQAAAEDVADDELDQLSAREQEVMRLIAQGATYKEVAHELFVSVKTVETHMSAVLRKLQLSNRNELTRWAARRNII